MSEQWPGQRVSKGSEKSWPGQRVDAPKKQGGRLSAFVQFAGDERAKNIAARTQMSRAFMRSAEDALTFNTSDERAGQKAARAEVNKGLVRSGQRLLQGDVAGAVRGVGEAFDTQGRARSNQARQQALGSSRKEQQRLRQEYPVSSVAGAIAGGLPTLVVGAGAAGAARAVAPNAMRAVAARLPTNALARGATVAGGAGAGYGALSGAGDAVEGQRVGGAVRGVALGAVTGAALPVAARGALSVGRGAARIVGRPSGVTPEQTAARVLKGQVSPKAKAQIEEARRLGLDDLALVDVLRNSGKRKVRAASSRSDQGQELAVNYREQVRQALPDRGQQIAQRMTGGSVNLPAAREVAEANVRAIDAANYPPLMQERLIVTPEMLQTLRPQEAQNAINTAIRIADTSGRQNDVAALRTLQGTLGSGDVSRLGGPEGVEVSASSLEDIYRALRDTSSGLSQSTGEQAANRSVGYALGDVTRSFDEQLQNLSPGIANARAASRNARQGTQALEVGYNAFNPSMLPDQVQVDVGALPQSAMQNVLAGGQARLQQQIGENPFAAINAMAYRPNMSQRLAVMGAPAEDMTRAAQIEIGRARNADFISPNTGSQTELRLSDAADMAGGVPVTPMGWASKLADFAFRRLSRLTDDEMETITRMGLSSADLSALQQIAQETPDQLPRIIRALLEPRGAATSGAMAGQLTGRQY